MPFYPDLKIYPSDTTLEKQRKKRIADGLLRLRKALREHIQGAPNAPEDGDTSQYLRLGTWNIREFDSPKFGERTQESNFYIAEILSHFDLIAVQEVREDLAALKKVMRILGPDWDFIATDVTGGTKGNGERMAFVFNRRKTWFRKVAGEITLSGADRLRFPDTFHVSSGTGLRVALPENTSLANPGEVRTKTSKGRLLIKEEVVVDLPAGTEMKLPAGSQLVFGTGAATELKADRTLDLGSGRIRSFSDAARIRLPADSVSVEALQFARTPFAVLFQAGWLKLMLCTVHIFYGADEGPKLARRNEEIRTLTKAMAERARDDKDSDADSYFFLLGDFNIVGKEHATWAALHENAFVVPEALREIPEGSNVKRDKAYDQIAVWTGKSSRRHAFRAYTRVEVRRAGIFDYFKLVYRLGSDDPNKMDENTYAAVIKKEQEKASGKPVTRPWKYAEWRTYQLSDHLPMWIELKMDFSDEYLSQVLSTE